MMTKAQMLCRAALLGAAAVMLGYVEYVLAIPSPVPGVKLGLGNAAVLFTMYFLNPACALAVAAVKVILCAVLFSGFSGFLYSAAGAALSFLVMYALYKSKIFGTAAISAAGGMAHNAGQILVAYLFLGSAVFYHLPLLLVTGAAGGAALGIVVSLLLKRIK